jgi:activator of 2-hydroxyglutaryl-CoA dehydratase
LEQAFPYPKARKVFLIAMVKVLHVINETVSQLMNEYSIKGSVFIKGGVFRWQTLNNSDKLNAKVCMPNSNAQQEINFL